MPPGSRGASGSRGRTRSRSSLFGDGATSEGAFHEGANLAAVIEGAARPALQQQPVGHLDPAQRADRGGAARRQGGRVRDARRSASTDTTSSPSTRPSARLSRARGPAAGRRSSRRSPTARRPTRRPTTRASTSTPGASRQSEERDCVAVYEGYLRRLGLLDDEPVGGGPGRGARDDARRRSRPPRPSRPPSPSSSSRTRTPSRRAALARDLDELDRVHGR